MDNAGTPEVAPVREAVADAQALAREQVGALWQLQIDRVREQLESGWREQLDRVFEERFAEVEARLSREFTEALERYRRDFSATELARGAESAAMEATDRLNQTARRMKHAENREVWIQALLERAADFCGRAALFAVKGHTLRYEAGLGMNEDSVAASVDVALENAPAFKNAVESKDTTVSAATARDLSDEVARLVGESPDKRAYLFPFTFRGQVVGVLYSEPGASVVRIGGLELLTALAETTIEPEVPAKAEGLVRVAGAVEGGSPWTGLSAGDQELHARAERFARSRVAELMLYHIQRVKEARAARDVYGSLKEEIDAGRAAYREQFLTGPVPVPDYLHAELIRTVAKGDAAILGESYPGPLV